MAGNPYGREKINTVDLLVLSSSDQLLSLLNYIFFLTKQPIFMRRSTVLSLLLQKEFPGRGMKMEKVVSELQISLLMAMWAVDCVFTLNLSNITFCIQKLKACALGIKLLLFSMGKMYKNVHP